MHYIRNFLFSFFYLFYKTTYIKENFPLSFFFNYIYFYFPHLDTRNKSFCSKMELFSLLAAIINIVKLLGTYPKP